MNEPVNGTTGTDIGELFEITFVRWLESHDMVDFVPRATAKWNIKDADV